MARMSQEEADAWIASHGGGQLQHGVEQKRVPNPSYNEAKGPTPSNPQYVDIEVETWTNSKTGAKLTLKHQDDGSWDRIDAVDADPNKPAGRASPDESVSAPPTQPYIATRQPDGTIKWEPNRNYKPTDEQKGTTQFIKGGDGKTYAVPIDASGKAGTPVDTGLPAEPKPGQHVVIDSPTGKQVVQIDQNGNARVVFTAPAGAKTEPQDVLINGVHHTKVTTTQPNGTVTTSWLGPDGKPEAEPPSTGQASVGGPSMAQYIRNGSIQGLTALHTALWNDPSITPEQREKRFQEAVQVANLAVQQAATDQRERESTRNAEYNTASTKLQYMQNGLNNALDFVSKLNGMLPEGSGLGGQAFAALLGLQMLQMQASGINNLPSLNRPPTPTITAADLNDPAKMAEHNQSVSQATAAAASPAPPAVQGTPSVVGDTGAPPVPATAPRSVGPTPASATQLPPNRPDQTQVGGQIDNAIMPPQTPLVAPGIPVNEFGNPLSELGQPGDPGYQDQAPLFAPREPATYSKPAEQPQAPDYGQPGMNILPQPAPVLNYGTPETMQPGTPIQVPGEAPGVSVPYPSNAGAESRMTDWPALTAFGSPMAQPQAGGAASPSGGGDAMLAARRAQIASTPPWRLSPEDLQFAQDNGLMDEALRVPGSAA